MALVYRMKLNEAQMVREFTIFVSSGADAAHLRQRVRKLVLDAVNPQLRIGRTGVRIEIDRWEDTAAARTRGENTNAQFVERAKAAQLTLALLLETLGDGTKEELEAVLETDQELSALWFIAADEDPDSEVGRFLDAHKDRLLHSKAGRPESDESWINIVSVLTGAVVEALRPAGGDYLEQR